MNFLPPHVQIRVARVDLPDYLKIPARRNTASKIKEKICRWGLRVRSQMWLLPLLWSLHYWYNSYRWTVDSSRKDRENVYEYIYIRVCILIPTPCGISKARSVEAPIEQCFFARLGIYTSRHTYSEQPIVTSRIMSRCYHLVCSGWEKKRKKKPR